MDVNIASARDKLKPRMDENAVDQQQILLRLEHLEAVNAIRYCLHRYMEICDQLDAHTDLTELMALFDANCIWEGVGEKYSKSFGRYDSWQAVHDMFLSYIQGQSHFVLNAHFLNSEQISFDQAGQAQGTWMMLQCSSFQNNQHHLNAAKLRIKFAKDQEGKWKMKHFQTENIFSRPVSHWHSTATLPVPKQCVEIER